MLMHKKKTSYRLVFFNLKFNKLKARAQSKAFLWKDKMKFSLGLKKQELDI